MSKHIKVGNKLLQINKKFLDLKRAQQEEIQEWMFEAYTKAHELGYKPKEIQDYVLNETIKKIKKREIWIPDSELYGYYRHKVNRFEKRYNNRRIKE